MSVELTPFAEILNNCLEAIERGEATAQECLMWYPEHQEQLRPLLTVAERLNELHSIQPSEAFRSRAAARLQTRLISSGRPPQPGNGNGSGPTPGIGGGLSSGLGRLGLLLLGLSVAAGLASALPRPDNPDVKSPTIEPPTVQVEQAADEVEPVEEEEPPTEAAPTSQPRPSPTASVGANYGVQQDVFSIEEGNLFVTPEQAAPPGLVDDPAGIDPGGEPTSVDDSSNNGHGNNLDGVDSSNPSQSIGGLNGEDDPSDEVNDGSANNGHGDNIDGVDSSNPGQGGGGPNGQDDPSGEIDDESGNNSNNGNGNDHPGKDK